MLYTLKWMESPAWMTTCEWHLQLSIAHLGHCGCGKVAVATGKAIPTNNENMVRTHFPHGHLAAVVRLQFRCWGLRIPPPRSGTFTKILCLAQTLRFIF